MTNRQFKPRFSNRSTAGFTIIELMIALAVAGIIMTVVFLAVPQAQRSTRDNARRTIASRLRGEIESYAANHEGQYPSTTDTSANPNVGNCPAGDSPSEGDWSDFYATNVQGKINVLDPSTGKEMIGCKPSTDYSNANYYVKTYGTGVTLPNSGIVAKRKAAVIFGSVCSGTTVAAGANSNNFAVVVGLENGLTYCTDNR